MVMRNEYETSDLYYAAYLKAAGVLLVDTKRVGGRVQFVFEHSEMIKKLEIEFYNRTAKIIAFNYADEIRAMKSLTHNKMR